MKISFDVDGTLMDSFEVQSLCKSLVAKAKYDIFIITRRYAANAMAAAEMNFDEHSSVFELAHRMGIASERVYFTNRDYKYALISSLNIDIHIDDDYNEILLIQQHTCCHALYLYSNYQDQLHQLLNTP